MACSCFQLLALLLAVMAAITLGLGVAQFIATYFLAFVPYCRYVLGNCTYAEPVVYAFIMPGVWGSIGAFATGILAIKAIANMTSWRSVFSTVAFITAVILLPAMISVSIVNAVKVIQSPDGFSGSLYNVSTGAPNSTSVLFILPIVIVVMGFIEFFLTAGLFIYACVCLRPKFEPDSDEPIPIPVPVPRSAPEAIYPGPTASYSPYGPLPYRRPAPIYGDPSQDPGFLYRPGLRSFVPGRYPSIAGIARPYPLPYSPPGY
jgi:hypothetical protein